MEILTHPCIIIAKIASDYALESRAVIWLSSYWEEEEAEE